MFNPINLNPKHAVGLEKKLKSYMLGTSLTQTTMLKRQQQKNVKISLRQFS